MRATLVFAAIAAGIVVALFGVSTRSERPDLEIKILGAKEGYILGEPLVLTEVWKNTGGTSFNVAYDVVRPSPMRHVIIDGKTTEHCVTRSEHVNWTPLPHRVLSAGESLDCELRLSEYGVANEGTYEIWITYDATELSGDWMSVGVQPVKVESNHIRFTITKPEGNDEEAFKKFGAECNEMGVDQEARGMEILRLYPKSMYAAWASRYRLFGPQPPKWRELSPEVILRNLAPPKEGARDLLHATRVAIEQHPDLPFATDLRFGEVFTMWQLGDKDEARRRLRALQAGSDKTAADYAKKYLEAAQRLSEPQIAQ